MPCYDPRDSDCTHDRDRAVEYERKYQNLTRMLCAVMNNLDEPTTAKVLKIKGLKSWWDEHQVLDEQRRVAAKARRERKKKKQIALDKLTVDERRLLNLE